MMRTSLSVGRALALGVLLCSPAARALAAECGYPVASGDPRTSVVFNEGDVLRSVSPDGSISSTPGTSIKALYSDDRAALLGIRRVIVKTKTGSTQTDYPVTAMTGSPSSAVNPQVGTTALDGDQAG